MAITNAKVVHDLSYIKDKTPVKFKTFGIFFIKLMMLSVEDQEFIIDSLKNAADSAQEKDGIVIITFSRPKVKLKREDDRFRFMIEHQFNCELCKQVHTEEVNCYGGKFRSICEWCMEKAEDYRSDSIANQLYD